MLVHTLVWTAFGIIVMLVNPTGCLYMYLARVGWARHVLRIGGLPVTIKGLENIDCSQSYVICSNHQSLLDIPILVAKLPITIRFVSKRSLFYIPIFGWSLWAAGFIPVDRGAGKKAHESLRRAAKRLRNRRSIAVFPEGTRSPDGEIHPFKSGAFVIAIEAGVPVLPVVVKGTFQAGPKSAIRVIPHPIELSIGVPISTGDMEIKDRNDLSMKTREAMVKMFGDS